MRRWMTMGLMLVLMPLLGACATFEGSSNRYVIFYPEWSAQLDDSAKGVVDGAAGFALRHPMAPVTVVGFADLDGSPQANKDISRARAHVVVDELVARGVPAARIQSTARGSTNFIDSSQESRRVEIDVGTP